MNLKDLCGLDSLGELLDAGVCSLKIEGRMKSPRYTAGVVSIYRKYVDLYKKVGSKGWKTASEDKEFLAGLFDRGGFSDGYFHMQNGRKMLALSEKPFRQADTALFEYLDRAYVQPEKKEKIKGNIRITQDLPVKLSFRMGGFSVFAKGEPALPAKNRPLSDEDVKRQIEKLGDTPFILEQLEVEIAGDCFVPVSTLNELRRKAVSALRKEILKAYRRERYLPGKRMGICSGETGLKERKLHEAAREGGTPRLSVLVEEEAQFFAAVKEGAVSRIYLSADAIAPKRMTELAGICKAAKKECFLALPRIWREKASFWREEAGRVETDGFLVRVLDEFDFLYEKQGEFVADASLYTFNGEAREALFRRGFSMDTAPLELNARELKERGMSGSEMIVYGRLPMMVSAQCIRKTVMACTRQAAPSRRGRKSPDRTLFLKDRKRMRFPVKQYCQSCYNVIYNSAPLWLAAELPEIAAMGPEMLRLQFTTEKPEEVSLVIQAYEAALAGEKYTYQPEIRTRGHFRRGVE